MRKSKFVALLVVCVMVFGVVEPALAWGNRTGSQTGDAVAYGAGAGTVAAGVAAAALIFFTGGLAAPVVIGAAAVAGAAGAAGGAYYGYNVEEKSLVKDAAVIAGAGAGGGVVAAATPVVAPMIAGLTAAEVGGGAAVGGGGIYEAAKEAAKSAVDEAKKHPVKALFGVASTGYEGAQILSAFVKPDNDKNTECTRKLDERLQKLTKSGKKVVLKKVEFPSPDRLTAHYTVDGVEHVETFYGK